MLLRERIGRPSCLLPPFVAPPRLRELMAGLHAHSGIGCPLASRERVSRAHFRHASASVTVHPASSMLSRTTFARARGIQHRTHALAPGAAGHPSSSHPCELTASGYPRPRRGRRTGRHAGSSRRARYTPLRAPPRRIRADAWCICHPARRRSVERERGMAGAWSRPLASRPCSDGPTLADLGTGDNPPGHRRPAPGIVARRRS